MYHVWAQCVTKALSLDTVVLFDSLPAGWRLFVKLTTMPSIGFRLRRQKHSLNEMKCRINWTFVSVNAWH